jgi:hypothetical protein
VAIPERFLDLYLVALVLLLVTEGEPPEFAP